MSRRRRGKRREKRREHSSETKRERIRSGAGSGTNAYSWFSKDGFHVLGPGERLTEKELARLSEEYQTNIRKSPLWDEMVAEFGLEKTERLLKEFRVQQSG